MVAHKKFPAEVLCSFLGQAPYNWGSDKSAYWLASPWAGRVKNIRTSWECDPLRTCFYQLSSIIVGCKSTLRIFECVESLSLQELAFLTIHPMLACSAQHQHWTSAQSYISYCVAFWYFRTSVTPFFHVPHQWLAEHHNLPSRVSSNQYAWHCMIDYMW